MGKSPFNSLPIKFCLDLYEALPSVQDQAYCREIYNALFYKGPMQLMQLRVVVTGENLKSDHCRRLLIAMSQCGLIRKESGKKTYKAF